MRQTSEPTQITRTTVRKIFQSKFSNIDTCQLSERTKCGQRRTNRLSAIYWLQRAGFCPRDGFLISLLILLQRTPTSIVEDLDDPQVLSNVSNQIFHDSHRYHTCERRRKFDTDEEGTEPDVECFTLYEKFCSMYHPLLTFHDNCLCVFVD